ncbi:helix-turn-helix domain-containing protein [Anaerocolumna sp.]|uniref:helix-turn-helix domain-containing protein n=1 Tax=Anaerocolumna sp. TaxID=2041569 RepID=UPI0028A585C6|nr:helix-turn-helix transcriptional regulator [Anaerocolumna sp.]
MNTANRLKKLRLERGISQEKCAQDTGISVSSIKRYEKSGIIGNTYNLIRLAEYFSVDMDYIYNPNEHYKRNEESNHGIKRNRNKP